MRGVRSRWIQAAVVSGFCLLCQGKASAHDGPAFDFARDTFAFPNQTVFDYRDGIAYPRKPSHDKNRPKPYTLRCFVMSRAVVQFKKFARFDPKAPPLDDAELVRRVRVICRQHPWEKPWPSDQQVLLPGYADLRELSKRRGGILQENIGLGWPTYLRVGNWRMFGIHSRGYQAIEHVELEAALQRGDFFVAYLSTYPSLSINHAVLVYAHRSRRRNKDGERYWVYDPNHAEKRRTLTYSTGKREFTYEKDWDFVGGFVRVFHVFGKPWQ